MAAALNRSEGRPSRFKAGTSARAAFGRPADLGSVGQAPTSENDSGIRPKQASALHLLGPANRPRRELSFKRGNGSVFWRKRWADVLLAVAVPDLHERFSINELLVGGGQAP